MADGPFRILLSHSPDQIDWAIRQRFPLMLAGHTHGGQIVFPVIGPVVSPSKYGTKYAGGLFQVSGVVMHVSRGLSGEEPVRWNCPPELAILTLVSA
jgi:predicted MPP superfamily phosphohydrolase